MNLAIYNPHNKPIDELKIIFGFNNGGGKEWWTAYLWDARLLSEDGDGLGSHLCSSEVHMPQDLGILEGTRPDRHEVFQKHYPDGYRMQFVKYDDVQYTPKLVGAIKNNSTNFEGEVK